MSPNIQMQHVDFIFQGLRKVREQHPLVLAITNYVTANINANALLAIGASPIMSHQIKEMEDITKIADAVVANMGIPVDSLSESLIMAGQFANRMGKPLIFDPVGVGASEYRNQLSEKMLTLTSPDIIKGNASEIMALSGQSETTSGVDSSHGSLEAVTAAIELAKRNHCTICVSGEVDLITDGEKKFFIYNGHPMMARITGMGCTAGVLSGAFAAVIEDKTKAMTSCMAVLGIAGEIAAEQASGPATLQLHLIDTLYSLTRDQIESRLKLDIKF